VDHCQTRGCLDWMVFAGFCH